MATTLTPAPTSASVTSPATDDGLWITRLFADSTVAAPQAPALTSPSAAYQDALYERAYVVDLRTGFTRTHQGAFADDLGVVVDPTSPSGYAELVRLAGIAPLVLVTSDGSHALRISEHLRSLGMPEVSALRGGFGAWLAYGLPVA